MTDAKPKAAPYTNRAITADHCTPHNIVHALETFWPHDPLGDPGCDLDPCASDGGKQYFRAKTELTGPQYGEDGLAYDWSSAPRNEIRPARAFWNCPYGSALHDWTAKAVEEWDASLVSSIGLVPAYTSSAWFHRNVLPVARALCWVRGRLRFIGSTSSALLVLVSSEPDDARRFAYAFGEMSFDGAHGRTPAPIGTVQVLRP